MAQDRSKSPSNPKNPRKSREAAGKTKLREYFIRHVGEIIDARTLQAVAGGDIEFGRRIRELRNEEGMDILTKTNSSAVKAGQYMLRSLKPKPAFARDISTKTRAIVLERNGYTCQMCGAGAGEPHPYDPNQITRLHIGHIVDKSHGGTDDPSNLRAICSVCNEGASNIAPEPPSWRMLLAQIKRGTIKDQLQVMEWLIEKFPNQAAEFTRTLGEPFDAVDKS
jgi:hypothetical protein